jgi:hypothetical protein
MFKSLLVFSLALSSVSYAQNSDGYCNIGCNARQTFTELQDTFTQLSEVFDESIVGNWQVVLQADEIKFRNTVGDGISAYYPEPKKGDVLNLALGEPDFLNNERHVEISWPVYIKSNSHYRLENAPENILRWTKSYSGSNANYSLQCRQLDKTRMICKSLTRYEYLQRRFKNGDYTNVKYVAFARTQLPVTPYTPPVSVPTEPQPPKIWQCVVNHPGVGYYVAQNTSQAVAREEVLNKCTRGARQPPACYVLGASCTQVEQ